MILLKASIIKLKSLSVLPLDIAASIIRVPVLQSKFPPLMGYSARILMIQNLTKPKGKILVAMLLGFQFGRSLE